MNQLLLHDAFFAAAARYPGRVAATRGEAAVTYAELAEAVPRYARALSAHGLRRGDRLAWWGSTSLELIPLYFASAALGATFTPANPAFSDEEARAVFDLADPRLVVVDDAHEGDVRLDDLRRSTDTTGVVAEDVQETDGHIMFFTSGTTGVPKAIELSHRTDLLRFMSGLSDFPDGATVSMFPLFHMSGWSTATGPWLRSEEVVLADGADAAGFLEAIERRRARRFYAIPAVWRRILELDVRAYDLASLRQADTGTSATTVELLDAIHDALPQTTTTVTYGSTEAGGVCVLAFEDIHRKPGSVGPPRPAVFIRVDERGALWTKSPYLFDGYFRNPEATAAAIVDGWYHTGELGEIDDEGYLSIVGRTSEMIRTGGETVSPAEVDTVLVTHSAVLDGAVAGVPDDDWGEIVTAFVVCRPGASITLEDLQAHCAPHLARFKVPRRLVVVDEIPRTGATRQVQRRALLERDRALLDPA
jgi:acyl-CoA synthetase (AMP-forming)/AMP-acid ligase II